MVNILILGKLDEWIIEEAKKCIREKFLVEPRLLGFEKLPSSCLNKIRNQYNSTCLIFLLDKKIKDKTLCLTNVDLYADGLNYVFGEAQLDGKIAILSVARLDPTFYGLDFNKETFVSRFRKEIMHELGHLFGLHHCSNYCVMRFSNSILEVDKKPEDFCKSCKEKLRRKLKELFSEFYNK